LHLPPRPADLSHREGSPGPAMAARQSAAVMHRARFASAPSCTMTLSVRGIGMRCIYCMIAAPAALRILSSPHRMHRFPLRNLACCSPGFRFSSLGGPTASCEPATALGTQEKRETGRTEHAGRESRALRAGRKGAGVKCATAGTMAEHPEGTCSLSASI